MFSRVAAACGIAGAGLFLIAVDQAEARGSHTSTRSHFVRFHRPVIQPVVRGVFGQLRPVRRGLVHQNVVGRHHGRFGHGLGVAGDASWGGGQVTVVSGGGADQSASAGVQAIAGIREAPPSRPAIYVIEEEGEHPAKRTESRSSGSRILGQTGQGQWAELQNEAEVGTGPLIIRVPVR